METSFRLVIEHVSADGLKHKSIGKDVGGKKVEYTYTNLLSLPCSFLSLTFSHFLNRKRLRRGEALGVEQLDQEDGASSSLDGVIDLYSSGVFVQ